MAADTEKSPLSDVIAVLDDIKTWRDEYADSIERFRQMVDSGAAGLRGPDALAEMEKTLQEIDEQLARSEAVVREMKTNTQTEGQRG